MKKYTKVLAVTLVLVSVLGIGSYAHAVSIKQIIEPTISLPSNIGSLTSQSVGTVSGVEVEIDKFTAQDGTVTNITRTVSKAIYDQEIARLNEQITALQAQVTTKQGLEAQLAN